MAGQRVGLPLPLLLLSLAVPRFVLGTTATDVTATVSSILPTSSTPTETSVLLPTTTAIVPPSSPETGAPTQEGSSTPQGISSAPSPTAPAPTTSLAETLTTLADTTAAHDTSTGVPGSTPTPSQPMGTTDGATPDISTLTMEPTLSTLTAPETPSAATGASHLFLSLRLTVPLDLENTMVQELVLSKLRGDLQTAFPYAGLAVEWRGKRRT